MEPIKIEIQVGLKPETIEAVKQLMLASVAAFMELCKNTTPAEAPTEEPKAEPAPEEKAAEPAPVVDDMPDFDDITDAALVEATRAAVLRFRSAGESPTIIRTEVFAKYGISQSTDCPKEKRAALIAELNALKK